MESWCVLPRCTAICLTLHVKKRGGPCVAPRSPARVAFCCVKAVSPRKALCSKTLRAGALRAKNSAGRCMKEARGSVAPPSAQHVVFCGRRGRAALRVEAPGPLRCAQHAVFYGILVRSSALYGHMPHVARQKTRGALRCTPKPRACCFLLRESSLRGRRCVPKNSAGRCMKEARGSVAPRCVQKPFWAKEGAHCVARRIPARGNYPFFVPCGLCIRKAEAPRGGSIRVAAVFLQKSGARSCGIRKARPAGR